MDRDYIIEDIELQDPLGAFAVERATRTFGVVTALPAPPVPALPPRRRWLLRAATVVTVVAVSAFVTLKFARIQRELARATAVAEISARQLAESEQRVRELSARNATRVVAADVAPLAPPTNVLAFPLVKVRSNRFVTAQNRVALSGDAAWVILVTALDAPPISNLYRSTIDRANGERVWSNDRLSASQADTFAVGLSSRLLPAGDYVLTIEEQAVTSDAWTPIGRYTFRVIPQDVTSAR